MALLTRSQILEAKDLKTIKVEVPEWGGDVIVSVMTAFARDKFEASVLGKNGGVNSQNIRAKLAAATLVDEEGNLLFTEDDIIKLGKKSCSALDRIFAAAQGVNHFSDKDVEDLAKN